MTEQEPDNQSVPTASGFEDESAPRHEEQAVAMRQRTAKRGDRLAEFKANFNSVFGHGIGKAALILAVGIIIVTGAFAIRGFNKAGQIDPEAGQFDQPSAPAPTVSIDPIDAKEAQRRAEQARLEAAEAQRQGKSYQPDFNPIIVTNPPAGTQPPATTGNSQPIPPAANPNDAQGQAVTVAVPPAGQPTSTVDEQRRQAELEKKRAAVSQYVDQVRNGVKEQAEELLGGKGKEGGLRGGGSYSIVSYLPAQKPAAATSTLPANNGLATSGVNTALGTAGNQQDSSANNRNAKKKVIFKAGRAIYALTDSEINTDEGSDVFATVYGGPYDGAKLIGKVENTPRNIKFVFSVLSPQDDRPSLSINAVAIREEDAKQGMADTIDHHTLERYTALFAGSVLSGFGKAAAQPQGSVTILPNGQTVQQQEEPSNKRIAMFALGEIGTNAGAEIRQGFNRPPTYQTAAQRGIGVVFRSDVMEP